MRGFLLRLGLQLLIVLDARAVDHQLTLHVHPLGDDANDGSALAPMRTPNGARDKLRQLISTMDSSGSLEGGMTEVILHPGIYPPLHLHEADSGTIQHPVLWTGRPGAVLSGGVQIPPHLFTPRSPGDEVLVANLSAVPDVPADLGSIVHGSGVRGCLNDRVELFVGTHRMVLARFPNLNVQPSDGTISWDANWLRGNGNFNMHGSEAYCKGEDPQNVTGCILLNPLPKALGAHVHDVATSLGSCANVSGEWRDKYQPAGSDTMHITQVGCSLTITDPAGSWRTATGTIDGVQITAKFGGKPTSPVLIGVYHDGTTPRKITWSNHGVWTQGHYPPCPLKVCATHPNRTYCPSNSTPGQCDHAPSPASSCPPCATSPVAQRAARWVAEGTGWIHAYLLFDWADTYNKIIDVVRGVELRYDPPDQTRNNARFYVVNLLSELDAPGASSAFCVPRAYLVSQRMASNYKLTCVRRVLHRSQDTAALFLPPDSTLCYVTARSLQERNGTAAQRCESCHRTRVGDSARPWFWRISHGSDWHFYQKLHGCWPCTRRNHVAWDRQRGG
jgi:hypothetical protein|eukprot:COSAG02_NODE_900_length_16073_cov_87.296607_3_plen_560_part_00